MANPIGFNAKPIFDEIATIDSGRDITRAWVEPLLLAQDSLLASKGGYDLQFYEEVLKDEQVHSCYQQRFGGLTSCEWEVKAGGTKRIDQKAADFIREQLTGIPWDDINEKHLYALHYGYSVAECLWMRDGAQIALDDTKQGIRVRNRRRFRFDADYGLRLITWSDRMIGERMPDRKFWTFCVGADHHDEPYGKGLGHWLYWLSYFKRNDMRVWLRFLEKFSMPTVAVEYPNGMPKDQQDALLKVAYSVLNASAVKLPQGAALSFLEASRSGTADYQALWDTCNAGIAKVILSQTMTTDNGSSRSQAEVHEGVARRVIKSDADLICQSFNASVVRWLVDWNFPGAAYPQVWRNTGEAADLKAQADRDKVLFDMGFVPGQAYVQETYGDGFALPGEDAPAGLNGTQLDSILQIVDAIQSGTLSTEVGQELIGLAVPAISADIAERIATPPAPPPVTADAGAAPPVAIEDVAGMFGEARTLGAQHSPQLFAVLQVLDQAVEAAMITFDEVRSDAAMAAAVGRRLLALVQGELEFAAKKGGKGDTPAPAFAEGEDLDAVDRWVEEVRQSAGGIVDGWAGQIQELMEQAGSLTGFAETLLTIYPQLEGGQLRDIMGDALMAASLAGAAELGD
jgi:phage gp29-like protein